MDWPTKILEGLVWPEPAGFIINGPGLAGPGPPIVRIGSMALGEQSRRSTAKIHSKYSPITYSPSSEVFVKECLTLLISLAKNSHPTPY